MMTAKQPKGFAGRMATKRAKAAWAASQERMAGARAATQAAVTRGTCPDCSTRVVRNTALAGWWQCGAYATESFRAPEFKGLPSCHWQGFTE